MGRRGDGETGRRGDGETGRWGDGEMGRRGDGERYGSPRLPVSASSATLADAGGELARVLCTPAWALVRGPAAGR